MDSSSPVLKTRPSHNEWINKAHLAHHFSLCMDILWRDRVPCERLFFFPLPQLWACDACLSLCLFIYLFVCGCVFRWSSSSGREKDGWNGIDGREWDRWYAGDDFHFLPITCCHGCALSLRGDRVGVWLRMVALLHCARRVLWNAHDGIRCTC